MPPTTKSLVSDSRSNGLDARECTVYRGGHLLIEDVSFNVSGGAALWLKGKNGSGKTSLLRAMAGLIPLADGQITLDEEELRECELHYIGHQDGLKARASVYENLEFYAALFEQLVDCWR